MAAGCSDAGPDPIVAHLPSKKTTSTLTYGWSRAITTAAGTAALGERKGDASDTIAGHTLRQIVVDPEVRVRGDGQACVACHAWATGIDRAAFCDRVPAFLRQPTATGATDPENAKPLVLKDLLNRWYVAGCPE